MSLIRVVPAVLLLALAAPAAAHADATLSVTGTAPHKTLTFTVNDALDHDVDVSVANDELVVSDTATIGSPCAPVTATSVSCGPSGGFDTLVFAFAVGNDRLDVGSSVSVPVSADGGGGNDVLRGGPLADDLMGGIGDDKLHGGEGGDYLEGGEGVDTLDGGDGDDDLWTAESSGTADAAISCGANADVILDYDDADSIDDDCETIDPPVLDGPVWIGNPASLGHVLVAWVPFNLGSFGTASFEWERCDTSGAVCTHVDGADDSTYALTPADVGHRMRVRYRIVNALGYDEAESEPTPVVVDPSALRPPRPPRPTPEPRAPPVDPLKLTIAPFVVAGKPSFAIRNGRPIVDTGRKMACPGAAGGLPCKVHLVAYPSGASGHVHGRPNVAAESTVRVAAAAGAKVRFTLGRRAYAQLRAHHKLTLLINATITRPHSAPVRTTFTATVKTPARKRR